MEKLKKSVGFVDISDFSFLAQSFSEDEMINHIQKFYEEIGDIIVKNNGKIVKYYGDEILFIFDTPLNAYLSAKEMSKYYKDNLSSNEDRLNISIATGEVYIGEFGHNSLRLFDVFGSIVNTACKLQKAKEKSDGIAYCNETAKELE